ncbi:MAG: long-chain fatty acid--CoA ligase, partial [Actinobacteria bacterium]
DVIIRGGENLSPSEIEDALLRHPTVVGAAVVGLPDAEWGERVAAMVTLRPGSGAVDPADLRDWARQQLGSIKTPELIVVADELPQTPTGKVLRRIVKEQLEKQ